MFHVKQKTSISGGFLVKKKRAHSGNVFRNGLKRWFWSPTTSASDGEAEHVVYCVFDPSFLLEFFAELIAWIEGRIGTKGVLPALFEEFLGGLSITPYLSPGATRLMNVGSKEYIPFSSATICCHRVHLLSVRMQRSR